MTNVYMMSKDLMLLDEVSYTTLVNVRISC